jgi:hypothetical protein
MVKIALERNTCEEKALLSSIACDLFVLICQRNYAKRRVSRISQISLSANALIGASSVARSTAEMLVTLAGDLAVATIRLTAFALLVRGGRASR